MEVDNFPGGNAEDIIFDEKKVHQFSNFSCIRNYLSFVH